LSSLVSQTDTNFEVIIVDDCSTEDIKTIIDEYADKLDIIYIRNEENLGCGMSRQVGIDSATQKYIMFLDSDDMFMPYTVEMFDTIIAVNPNIEYIHSYFYEQIFIDNIPTLYCHKENYTACHGKLYNVDLIKKFGIENSPQIKYADDSFFNSMCGGLMHMSIVGIPTVLWTSNPDSVLRKKDPIRDAIKKEDFINAMLLSAKFILEKNGRIDYIKSTITRFLKQQLNETETKKLDELIKCVGYESDTAN
jgi:glycosyltransferase involved in cell wall biosynthesis